MAIVMGSLSAGMILAPAQIAGPERGRTPNSQGERRPAIVPRSMPKRPPRKVATAPPVKSDESIPLPVESRTSNGSSNNLEHPSWGTAGEPTIRVLPVAYGDGLSEPAGADRPSPRLISHSVSAQQGSIPNSRGATDLLWQWGQFLDHDLIETPTVDPEEPFDIEVPAGDSFFDPANTGATLIPLNRSLYEDLEGIRQQVNAITAYIDGSMIYGSDDERAYALRKLDGSGRMKVTESPMGDLLPFNGGGYENAPSPSPGFYLAGDIRANEQVGLTALHTLFVREHNHWATRFSELNPQAMGEEIYQFARSVVAAEVQAITYREFLPVLIGKNALPPYQEYQPSVRADISNAFGAAAFRIGHSMLSSEILRLDANGNEIEAGHLSLADAFFNPDLIQEDGIEPILRGMTAQNCQELDAQVVDEVRNFLFGPPGAGGFDLAALNIQRGRDHGIPGYNQTRQALGLRPARLMSDLNPDRDLVVKLQSVYSHPDEVDLWVGGLCEPDLPDSMVGPTFQRLLVDQFTRLRDGDRFYYESALPRELVKMINEQNLAAIIRRNTGIGAEIQDKVFLKKDGVDRDWTRRGRTRQKTRDRAPSGIRRQSR